MSRPTAISPEEQEQIARRIGVLLLQAAPEDWQQITVEYRATGEYHDLLGEVASQSGSSEPWDPPDELLGIFEHLREGMYRPDVGTWLSALYVVERPSSYRIDINFDSEPKWQRPLPRAAYADELRRYPRADENVPDWMREKLDSSGGGAPGGSPPGGSASQPPPPPTTTPDLSKPLSRPAPDALSDTFEERNGYGGDTGRREPERGNQTAHFRIASIFDDFDEHGRPLVATRTPVHPDESAPLRHYLENAPIVLASRDNDEDQLDSERSTTVPGTWHTDGVWLWQGAVAYYLAQYGVPPEPAFVDHIRSQGFVLPEVNDRTRDAARSELFDQPEDDENGQAGSPHASEPEAMRSEPEAVRGEPEAPRGEPETLRGEPDFASEPFASEPLTAEHFVSEAAADTAFTDIRGGFEQEQAEPSEPAPEPEESTGDFAAQDFAAQGYDFDARNLDARDFDDAPRDSWQPSPEPPAESETASLPEVESEADDEAPAAEDVLAQLHDKLTEHGVDGDSYRVGSRSASARCLVQEGPDWIVTPGPDDQGEEAVRFTRADQAAAYLLGSLLLSQASPEHGAKNVAADTPQQDHDAPSMNDLPRRTPQQDPEPPPANDLPRRTPAEPEADRRRSEPQVGGHFLFTANQDSAFMDEHGPPEPPPPESGPPGRLAPDAPETPPRPDNGDAAAADATRFQPMPHIDRTAPPQAPQSPPTGQPAQGPRPAEPGSRGPTPPGGPGQGPPPLPKRSPRPDGAGLPPAEHGNRPPGQQAPAGPAQAGPAGGADRRPGPSGPGVAAGPPRQGPGPGGEPPRPGGGLKRPPQAGGPQGPQGPQAPAGGQPPQAPPGGREQQQIQPLQGEPPLTLYRDRRQMVLQPGTELDRFGEPDGNVSYAIQTPYNQRSLPPQWSNRPYFAYRVNRPLQALRGTAVPWFEQPGGGTAYVLPTAISELVADGTLIDLSGSDAPPRPPME
jgi:hypothetical protein